MHVKNCREFYRLKKKAHAHLQAYTTTVKNNYTAHLSLRLRTAKAASEEQSVISVGCCVRHSRPKTACRSARRQHRHNNHLPLSQPYGRLAHERAPHAVYEHHQQTPNGQVNIGIPLNCRCIDVMHPPTECAGMPVMKVNDLLSSV